MHTVQIGGLARLRFKSAVFGLFSSSQSCTGAAEYRSRFQLQLSSHATFLTLAVFVKNGEEEREREEAGPLSNGGADAIYGYRTDSFQWQARDFRARFRRCHHSNVRVRPRGHTFLPHSGPKCRLPSRVNFPIFAAAPAVILLCGPLRFGLREKQTMTGRHCPSPPENRAEDGAL